MSNSVQSVFFKKYRNLKQMCELLGHLPDVYFLLKNTKGQFVYLNDALVNRLKIGQGGELIGLTDYDLYPSSMADIYRQEDLKVIELKKPVLDLVHQVVNPGMEVSWFHTIKKPVYDEKGKVVGVVGMMRDYQKSGTIIAPYIQMKKVLDYLNKNYQKPISILELANLVQMSPSHFQRVFRKLFHTSPVQLLTKTRILAARSLLVNSKQSITEIAYATGFYDHSHFSKQFKKELKLSPREYRTKYVQR